MPYSEILKFFDTSRPEFMPYGFTVEKWIPKLMPRADRHNEIEINLLTSGSIIYLFNDQKIMVPAERLIVFWALVPHQIIHIENDTPYYVCTIPFAHFMEWGLPPVFVDNILNGEVVCEPSNKAFNNNKYLLESWLQDVETHELKYIRVARMEMCARLNRFALIATPAKSNSNEEQHDSFMIDLVEKMIIYISQNYSNPIKNEDIGKAVGLHPDYANSLFKKSFGMTLYQYVLHQRILHVQRKLSVSKASITEIAFEAGFNSLSRFNAAFRNQCNCSPREYRKRHFTSSIRIH